MKEHLHQLAVDIFHTAKENNIEVEVEWIPRSLNKKADYLSKIVDFDDWTVKVAIFMRSTLIGSPFSRLFSLFTKTTRFPDFVRSSLILVLWAWIP